MAVQQPSAAQGGPGKPQSPSKPAAAPAPAPAPVQSRPAAGGASPSLSGLTPEQAKEFHEQFKVTYTAFVGLAALAHLLVIANNPWF